LNCDFKKEADAPASIQPVTYDVVHASGTITKVSLSDPAAFGSSPIGYATEFVLRKPGIIDTPSTLTY
jgi:hypothetical protein